MRSRTVAEAFVVALALTACVVPQSGAPAVLSVAEAVDLAARHRAVLVDVRDADAYARGHVPGAVNVPFPEVAGRVAELRRMALPILYCG